MQTTSALSNWKLFFQWVIVNTVCIIVSVPLVALALLILGSSINLSNDMENIVFPILFVSIMGILLGLFQSLILRSKIERAHGWILSSGIGLAIGVALIVGTDSWVSTWKLAEINSYLWIGAVLGVSLGTTQWLFLRRQMNQSILWIPASIFGGALGWAWGQTAASDFVVDSELGLAFVAVRIFSRLMITYSAFTGIVLAWLLNHRFTRLKTAA